VANAVQILPENIQIFSPNELQFLGEFKNRFLRKILQKIA